MLEDVKSSDLLQGLGPTYPGTSLHPPSESGRNASSAEVVAMRWKTAPGRQPSVEAP